MDSISNPTSTIKDTIKTENIENDTIVKVQSQDKKPNPQLSN